MLPPIGYVIQTPTGEIFTWNKERVERFLKLDPNTVVKHLVYDDANLVPTLVEEAATSTKLAATLEEVTVMLEKFLTAVRSNHEGGSLKTQDDIFDEIGASVINTIETSRRVLGEYDESAS